MELNDKLVMFENRLTKVYKHRGKQAKRMNISCYRLYDKDLPEFPICIELYDDKVYIAEYVSKHGFTEEQHIEWLEKTIEVIVKVLNVKDENVFIKQRKRMHHRNQQYEKTDAQQDFFTVEESGLKFLVNLTDYLDTGLFLDHRTTRLMVKEEAKNKRVLNLFCYTGSFSVYAANAGAAKVTSIDLSKTYLKWAEDNFAINLLKDTNNYQFIHADCVQYLKTIAPNSYDIIVMDPPTFSNSKRMDDFMDIQRDHVALINDCLQILDTNGVLYFSTNFTKFILDTENVHSKQIKDITKPTTPFDFEGKLRRWCYKIIKE
jgi:23S rRNA (cytosine1962-C5)-methyltransferase